MRSLPLLDANDPSGMAKETESIPTLLSHYNAMFVSAANDTFKLSTEVARKFQNYRNFTGGSVSYLRKHTDITKRGRQGGCTRLMPMLNWLMGEVNENSRIMMLAYGALIHLNREGDFIKNNKTGTYWDDDIDTWASLETVAFVASLEPEFFRRHGWTMCVFVTSENQGGYVVFAQIMSSCGHTVIKKAQKCKSSEPAIEMYPTVAINEGVGNQTFLRDLWNGNIFSESMLLPTQKWALKTVGLDDPLQLQIPNNSSGVLTCIYGNWLVPSPSHARINPVCLD